VTDQYADERYARFRVRVHASNQHAGLGQPVTVIAKTRAEAVTRAIDLGWSGRREDARVTFDRVEDLDPRQCPHVTEEAR
jgi:hypothetical protein